MSILKEKINQYYANYNLELEVFYSVLVIFFISLFSTFTTLASFTLQDIIITFVSYLGLCVIGVIIMLFSSLFILPKYSIFSFVLGFCLNILVLFAYSNLNYSGKGVFMLFTLISMIGLVGIIVISILNHFLKNFLNSLIKTNQNETKMVLFLLVFGYIILIICAILFLKQYQIYIISTLLLAGFVMIAFVVTYSKFNVNPADIIYNILIFIANFCPSLFSAYILTQNMQ